VQRVLPALAVSLAGTTIPVAAQITPELIRAR
ncbi:uncharacterized protein METZ01_LOCUS129275, partial [marine metagenome]